MKRIKRRRRKTEKKQKRTEQNRTEQNLFWVAGSWNSVYCVLCDFILEIIMLGYFTTTRESSFWSCCVTLVEATAGNKRDWNVSMRWSEVNYSEGQFSDVKCRAVLWVADICWSFCDPTVGRILAQGIDCLCLIFPLFAALTDISPLHCAQI